ncbi:MAG: hypothetical protein PVJ62_00440 [Deltaproteobacteria bacterium]|jgi:hypothetical protein
MSLYTLIHKITALSGVDLITLLVGFMMLGIGLLAALAYTR